MLAKLFLTTIFTVVLSMPFFAQTSYKGLVPGTTTRSQVDRTLGSAVSDISSTLSEYVLSDVAGKIYVQYRTGTGVVERIEVLYQESNDRVVLAGSLGLHSRPTASRVSSKGKWEEYYAAACIVLTFAGESVNDGVSRVGYYSRELFDGAVAKVGKNEVPNGERISAAPVATSPGFDQVSPNAPSTTMSSSSGSLQMTDQSIVILNSDNAPPDPEMLKKMQSGDSVNHSVSPNKQSNARLKFLSGTFEFSTPEMARQKIVNVENVGGDLRWSSQAFTDILVATGTGSQNDADGILLDTIYMFKFANKPEIRLKFFVRNGRTRQVVYIDSTEDAFGTPSTGFPKP